MSEWYSLEGKERYLDMIQKKRDEIEKEHIKYLENDNNLADALRAIAKFLELIAAGEESEAMIDMVSSVVQAAVNRPFEDRHKPINTLINTAIEREALQLALEEYPMIEGEECAN